MSYCERLLPVLLLVADLIQPNPRGRKKQPRLPVYCRKIAAHIRKTHFRWLKGPDEVLSYGPAELKACTSLDEARRHLTIDWSGYGAWQGVLELFLQLMDGPLAKRIEAATEGVPPEQVALVFGTGEQAAAEEALNPMLDRVKQLRAGSLPFAFGWGAGAAASMCQGQAQGLTGMFNDKLESVNGTTRENIYEFLAIAWPEIRAMQAAKPPKSRRDLFEWLQPFVKDSIVSLGDYDQLCDVCDEIGLRMKGRGRPRKAR